jgi:hypothetical protein
MIIVILVILLIWCVISWFIDINGDCDGLFGVFFGTIPLVIGVIVAISLAVQISNLSVIDQKIAMYEQENTKIEQQIETAVTAYQQHEKDVFTEVKPDSYIQLVSIYPELKSDTLVKEQIKTYQSNNKKIKELKVTAINGNVKRWWLYFGHKDVKY